jgi:hypothetical protein
MSEYTYDQHGNIDPATLPSADYAKGCRDSWRARDRLERAVSDVRAGRQNPEAAMRLLEEDAKRGLLSFDEITRNIDRAADARRRALEAASAPTLRRPANLNELQIWHAASGGKR